MSRGNGATPPGMLPSTPPVMPVQEAGGLRFVWAHDIIPNFADPGLVDGVLEDQSMTIVYGRSGSGKTAVTVDLLCRIASGLPWRDRQVKQGVAIYVAAENSESTRRRVWAWQQRFFKDRSLLVAVVQSPIIVGRDAVLALHDMVKRVEDTMGAKAQITTFDTLARTMKGDENSAEDMGNYVRWLDELRDRAKVATLAVHHTGKDEGRGARGSSALKAAADHELEVEKGVGSPRGNIRMTKVREGDLEGALFGFELKQRTIGPNRLGRDVKTVVVEECEPVKLEKKRGSAAQERVRQVLRDSDRDLTPEELRLFTGPISTGEPESERRAWGRLFGKDGCLVKNDRGYVEMVG